MFNYCSSLEELDASNFDTSLVTSLEQLFENCTSLKKLDLSFFNNLTNMDNMFSIADKLSHLILGKDCSYMTGLQFSNGNLWLDQKYGNLFISASVMSQFHGNLNEINEYKRG